MFSGLLSGLSVGAFASAFAFALLGDPHTAAWMLTGALVCSILAMVKRS